MSVNHKQTSPTLASLASEVLRDPLASETAKRLAASALAQTGTDKQSGKAMEHLASTVLNSNQGSEATRSLAASVLSQSNKEGSPEKTENIVR
jgi:hypothetical protein